MLREQQDPAVRLEDSVERYIDALHVAAEEVVAKSAAQALEGFANQLVSGLTDEPAWPTLRAHLLLLEADGADPHERLRAAYDVKELISANDRAAVLDWRLDHTSPSGCRDGPLPWLPRIADRIATDPNWGPYLDTRSQRVAQLADQVRLTTADQTPAWAAQPHALAPAELMADMQCGAPPPRSTPATAAHRGTPTRPRRPTLATATRQAAGRRGQPYRMAMAATARR